MGEGGALLVNNEKYIERAEIIREKGTNRSRFLRGLVDKYTWVDLGSSFLPSELNAAYLYPQLKEAENINKDRLSSWNLYKSGLECLEDKGYIELPKTFDDREHNAHMFYIKCADVETRQKLMLYLKEKGIAAVFHYVPLHSSEGGAKFGKMVGEDVYTTKESERLLRLPMYYGLKECDAKKVIEAIKEFYNE